jgi:hypothetical protein
MPHLGWTLPHGTHRRIDLQRLRVHSLAAVLERTLERLGRGETISMAVTPSWFEEIRAPILKPTPNRCGFLDVGSAFARWSSDCFRFCKVRQTALCEPRIWSCYSTAESGSTQVKRSVDWRRGGRRGPHDPPCMDYSEFIGSVDWTSKFGLLGHRRGEHF